MLNLFSGTDFSALLAYLFFFFFEQASFITSKNENWVSDSCLKHHTFNLLLSSRALYLYWHPLVPISKSGLNSFQHSFQNLLSKSIFCGAQNWTFSETPINHITDSPIVYHVSNLFRGLKRICQSWPSCIESVLTVLQVMHFLKLPFIIS